MSALASSTRRVVATVRKNGLPMLYTEIAEASGLPIHTVRDAVRHAVNRDELEIVKVQGMMCHYIKALPM